MTRRGITLVAVALVAVGAFTVALRAMALAQAEGDVAAERDALDRTAADLREWASLRDERAVVAETKRPTQDVIAQVNAVLRDAGIPTERLKNLEPEADVALAGRYRTQTLRFSLEHLSRSFLATWRAAKTVWRPRSLELTHVNSAADKDGGSLGFDARVVIAATYLSDAPPTPKESGR